MREKINKIKENWDDPKKQIIMKMELYGLFIIGIYLLIVISNFAVKDDNSTTKKTDEVNYFEMNKNYISNKMNIKYTINNYLIEGTIIDNILNATVEFEDGTLLKIKYDGENIYKVNKQEEIVYNEILNDINKNYLLPAYIINNISYDNITISKDKKSISSSKENNTTTIYYEEENISKIIILDNNITYTLEFN